MNLILNFLLFITDIHSKLITYKIYQTNDLCRDNWQGSICLPIFPLNRSDQPFIIRIDTYKPNLCPTLTFVYIRTIQCVYCSKQIHDIHCKHKRKRRMAPREEESNYRNYFPIVTISLASVLIIGSLFTLFFLKRSQAHTNLLELIPPLQQSNSNIKSLNHIKVPQAIKSVPANLFQPTHLTVPRRVKTTR